jgi:hypothetical protein
VGRTPTPPTGWTTINSGSSTNGHFNYFLQYIVRGASAPSLTTTYTGNQVREWFIVCYSGVNATPIDSQGTEAKVGASASAPDPPATVAVGSSALAFACGIGWNGAPAAGWGAMSGYTKREGAPSTEGTLGFNVLGGAEKQLAASGSENPAAFTGTPLVTDDTWGQTITLLPASGAAASRPRPSRLIRPRTSLRSGARFAR